MKRFRWTVLSGLAVLAATTMASAEEPAKVVTTQEDPVEQPEAGSSSLHNDRDRLAVRLGGFSVRFKTKARVDSDSLGTGTEIDLEDDTALDSSDTEVRLDGFVRFKKRHRLNYEFVGFRRNGSRILDEQFQFGDEIFDVDATLNTRFTNDVYKLAYSYDVVRRPTWDLGLRFGVSAFAIGMDLEAIPAGGGAVLAESEDVIAPIPTIGLQTEVKIAKNWFFRAGSDYFNVGVDTYKGTMTDSRATFDWYPFKHFGFGVGFNRLRMTFEDTGAPGVDLTYIYSGTMLYASYVF